MFKQKKVSSEVQKVEKVKKVEKVAPLVTKPTTGIKLFGVWDTSRIEISDIGLKPYINLSPVLVPKSGGRSIGKQFWKSKKSIVERLMNKLFVPGHKGKKHWRTSGLNTGKSATVYRIVKSTFEIIEKKTGSNPVQVLVRALEAGSPKEGITTIEYGGVRYPKAVDLAPQRRIDLVLRWITQGAYAASSAGKSKKSIQNALADELIATANLDQAKSMCLKKQVELERQAAASR